MEAGSKLAWSCASRQTLKFAFPHETTFGAATFKAAAWDRVTLWGTLSQLTLVSAGRRAVTEGAMAIPLSACLLDQYI